MIKSQKDHGSTLITVMIKPISEAIMATNPPKGDGHRNGAVRQRSQTQTPSGHWVNVMLQPGNSWM